MKKDFKKYWLLLVIFLCLPKALDLLFSYHLFDWLSMNEIEASDILGYIGSLVGGVCSLIAILIAIKQFTIDKKPVIIPRNKNIYYYSNYGGSIALLDAPDLVHSFGSLPMQFTPVLLKLENVTSNPAIAFEFSIDYKMGELYRDICCLIGGEPLNIIQSTWKNDIYSKQGVFNGNSHKTFPLPHNIDYMVMGIIYRLNDPDSSPDELGQRRNHFIWKSYKIAEMKLTHTDITSRYQETVFDIELTISKLVCNKADYEVILTFVMHTETI